MISTFELLWSAIFVSSSTISISSSTTRGAEHLGQIPSGISATVLPGSMLIVFSVV
jgi:hypothetical protein